MESKGMRNPIRPFSEKTCFHLDILAKKLLIKREKKKKKIHDMMLISGRKTFSIERHVISRLTGDHMNCFFEGRFASEVTKCTFIVYE